MHGICMRMIAHPFETAIDGLLMALQWKNAITMRTHANGLKQYAIIG